jgi:hypothetical protein
MTQEENELLPPNEALKLLKNAVKESHLDNQPHLDFSVVVAHEREKYVRAMISVKSALNKGELTEAEVKSYLGLNI